MCDFSFHRISVSLNVLTVISNKADFSFYLFKHFIDISCSIKHSPKKKFYFEMKSKELKFLAESIWEILKKIVLYVPYIWLYFKYTN